ncbi:FERM and PDZ domain-containing protein 1 [Geospiza fortis]|uniref:FERM and PDZ domain-containing protein 1 n=1 Tax=Geospiza fortis TaxID=48883 RepID=A0A6I9ZE03_GEOFO|nr:FERM and PDZ domain-containing protein 1 [Geospiza fortis]
MGDLETSLIHARKTCRIEQMVAKWLHRSRDSLPRGSVAAMDSAGDSAGQPPSRAKVTVTVYKDLVLQHYGFEICPGLPLTIASVTAGSTADGKLQPGDQLIMINSSSVDGLSVERAASLIRDAGDELLLTVLRCTAGSSLLFMPNVLKVYLENGQTKAFRFERSTTVKDIVLTLQEKLSIRSIAHFALVLEEQYNLAKIHLLHEEELIAQVVQKRDSHDYRCLFRVCFVPRDPLDLLQEDPVAFEYLYLQSCSDVLQERFAVEMKCSVALRLAALHIQERISACAQPQKVSLKYIERDWGIENFISPTLLRNMRGKDIKKAISYHLKRNQVLLDPRQKHALNAVQVRLSYLQILGELKMYSGMIFNATMMLQDRESYVALLVGARHGVSQIVNSKLNIASSLAEFPSISRVELSEDSERVSTVKIYLQDLKAGYDTASWEGTERSSCIPKRLRWYSLGENPSARQKHGQERELTCSKSLRKRRSFLKTDYTSQVSFPAAVPGSPQRCCSWPPAQPSAEDTGKGVGRGIPAAPRAQQDTAGTEPCSAPRDTQPDTTGTKSVMEWLVSSLLDAQPAGGQGGEEDSSLQPQHAPLPSLEPPPSCPSGAAQERCPGEADPGCVSEESPLPSAGWQGPGLREGGGDEVVPAQHRASAVPSAALCRSDKAVLMVSSMLTARTVVMVSAMVMVRTVVMVNAMVRVSSMLTARAVPMVNAMPMVRAVPVVSAMPLNKRGCRSHKRTAAKKQRTEFVSFHLIPGSSFLLGGTAMSSTAVLR